MGVCLSRASEESELAKQVLGTTKADAKTVRRLSALGVQEGEVWITRQTSDIRKVFKFGPQINKGQFGTIHVVTNSAGDKFACKQISKRKLAGTNAIRDVRREIEIMHHLRGHPNVITFHGAYEDANEVYMVMELCTGGDLFERIEKITTITERAAASLFRDLVETVSYCHTLGVIHRDLKPENFLITDRGPNSRIKLADFGLSCFYHEGQGEMHDVVGSAYYMAPEVIRREYGSACDTWSLGIMLHILLSGAPPFTGSTDADILRAVRTQEVDLTVSPWPSVSRHARHLVSKMLEKDQDKRIRLDQVLSHPWLRPDGTAPPRALQGGLRDRISQFRALNMFKREARRVLAAALPPEEVSGLKLLFENLDTDHDGMLSLDELRDGLARRGELLEDTDVKELLKAADLNCDGFVDYREFVAATYSLSRMQRKQVLLKAFRHFDLDGDGYITREELSSVLSAVPLSSPVFGGPGSPGTAHVTDSVTQLVAEADQDADGRVDYREFCAMVLTAGGADDGGALDFPDLGNDYGVGRSDHQLVQPANLPGLVDEARSRASGGGSIKRRDEPDAAVAAASSSSRPSQPGFGLAAAVAVPQTASGLLQGRSSGSVHGSVHNPGKNTGSGWSTVPSSTAAVIFEGPMSGGSSDGDGEGSGSEDSVLMAGAQRRPLQVYGHPGGEDPGEAAAVAAAAAGDFEDGGRQLRGAGLGVHRAGGGGDRRRGVRAPIYRKYRGPWAAGLEHGRGGFGSREECSDVDLLGVRIRVISELGGRGWEKVGRKQICGADTCVCACSCTNRGGTVERPERSAYGSLVPARRIRHHSLNGNAQHTAVARTQMVSWVRGLLFRTWALPRERL